MALVQNFNTRLKKFDISFPFFIAPMVGISHVAFRELVRFYTPRSVNLICFTEMLSTRRIPSERLDVASELRIAREEKYYIPQLLGNEEKFIAPSIEKLMKNNPWGFDINMGCPVQHTLKHNWGVRLMGDKNYASEVVRITKKHSPVPVSVKIRGGADAGEDPAILFDFTRALEDAGADFLTIHGRTREQKHTGEANWGLVALAREKLSLPVIANGNIQTAQDALSVLRDFNVDGAMIARAATARPWIIWQICELLGDMDSKPQGFPLSSCAPRTPEEEGQEYARACQVFLNILCDYFQNEEYILEKFRFFVATGARWLQFGHHFWRLTMRAKSLPELRETVEGFSSFSESIMYSQVKIV